MTAAEELLDVRKNMSITRRSRTISAIISAERSSRFVTNRSTPSLTATK